MVFVVHRVDGCGARQHRRVLDLIEARRMTAFVRRLLLFDLWEWAIPGYPHDAALCESFEGRKVYP